ncbi:murein biosynthesis integral membrane protein MurJ [Bacillus sp. V3-13]|uniref:murein biosynthesis integral membrane protein MurJ n=1 Tax=Bacillus sp. V3-13 TaxID=2053728 RepID=UPI000C7710B1|nr:murein biosynthesis integral membrane protein MurJ [Bacillus sp. V3-13]PLR76021.1 murein biosynthesis integral membrane protein MurJ [Bacillus sp. V3-13]
MKKTAFFLILISLIGKFLGFGKYVALSYYFGAGIISDAFVLSITIPTVIFAFIGIGLSTSFIPVYNDVLSKNGQEYANRFTSKLITLLLFINTALVALVFFNTDTIIKLFASGFTTEAIKLTNTLIKVSIIGVYFSGTIYILSSLLQVKKIFIIPAISEIPINIFSILGIYFASKGNIVYIQLFTIIGTIIQFIILYLLTIKHGYRYKFHNNLFDENVKKLLKNSIPAVLGISVNQINIIIDRTIASHIIIGGLAILDYANRITDVIQSVIVLSIISLVYPQVSKQAVSEDFSKVNYTIYQSVVSIMSIIIPITVYYIVFSEQIINIVYARGKFDSSAIQMTANCLVMFSIGMLSVGIRELLARVFYSFHDTKTPMVYSSLSILINILLAIILTRFIGLSGLPLATSLSSIITVVFFFISLKKKLATLNIKQIVISLMKILTASIIMGFAVKFAFIIMVDYTNEFISLLGAVLIGGAVYLFVLVCININSKQKIKLFI